MWNYLSGASPGGRHICSVLAVKKKKAKVPKALRLRKYPQGLRPLMGIHYGVNDGT